MFTTLQNDSFYLWFFLFKRLTHFYCIQYIGIIKKKLLNLEKLNYFEITIVVFLTKQIKCCFLYFAKVVFNELCIAFVVNTK